MRDIFIYCKNSISKNQGRLIFFLALSILSAILSLGTTFINGQYIDYLITGKDYQTIYLYCLFFGLVTLSSIFIGYLVNRLNTKMQIKMTYELNSDCITHLQNVSLNYTNNNDMAYMTQRINRDASEVITFCISCFQNIVINSIMLVLPFLMLYSFNSVLAIILISFMILFFISFKFLKKPLYTVATELKEVQSKYFSKLFEQLEYLKFIKSHGVKKVFPNRLISFFNDNMRVSLKYQNVSYAFTGLESFITNLAQTTLYVVGGIAVLQERMTVGQYSIIAAYFAIMLNSLRYFFNLGKSIQDTRASYLRLKKITDVNIETCGTVKLNEIKTITIENLSFAYNTKSIISNFSRTFKQGKIYSLTGQNGTGKSTFIDLLMSHYVNDYEGRISFNNIDLRNIDHHHLNKFLIGHAEQAPVLLNDTLKYNLLLDDGSKVEDNEIYDIIIQIGLDAFIRFLPQGLDTIVEDKGSNFSGGEKSKIALLRAFLKKPSVIILDEPTAALDKSSVFKLVKYLESIKQTHIIFISTHDAELINIADEHIEFTKP